MNTHLAALSYVALQCLRGEPVMQALEELRRTEFASLDELLSLQGKRQIEQIQFAFRHVPYYQKAYKPFAGEIESARTTKDANELAEILPILSRDTVMEHYEEFHPDCASTLRTHPDRTSGSSGSPLEFPCDQKRGLTVTRFSVSWDPSFWRSRWANATRCSRDSTGIGAVV